MVEATKHSSTGEWINTMYYIPIMEYYAAIKILSY